MLNYSDTPTYTAYTALAMMDDLFGIRIKEPNFDEWAGLAIQKIGLNLNLARAEVYANENGIIKLPSSIFSIDAVTTNPTLFNSWDSAELTFPRVITTDYIGSISYDYSQSDEYSQGVYLDFEVIDRLTIKTDAMVGNKVIYVLYTTVVDNSDGEWLFNYKQVEAIAYYCAFLFKQRSQFQNVLGKDLDYWKMEANRKVLAAKVPNIVTENQWDKVLDSKTSMGRKSYNDDYKF